MNLHRTVIASLVAILPLSGPASERTFKQDPTGQTGAPAQSATSDASVLTLRASSRLTLVDVTVTDTKGRSIQGLKSSDFHLEEDGKEQPIRNFEEMRSDVQRPVHQPPPLPPHVYTNLQPAPNSSAVNILLLDALNTKLADQAFVKSETLAYIKNMPPGTRVAIMTLSSQLRILQGFTQDADILTAAVKSKNNRQIPSPLMNGDVGDTSDALSEIVDAGASASLQEFANESNTFQTSMRNEMTLEALNQIAAYLSTIPGRKNLIWFTAGMPLQIFPSGGVNDLASMTDYSKELRKTTDLLTAAQIAVYPVDAQGLHGSQANNAANAGSGFSGGQGGPTMAAANMAFLNKTASQQLSMEAVAEATGGVAYYNTNGLKEAVTKAVANGANYYTIAYVPPNPKYDGAFHKIHVKVGHPGAQLTYRTGYYADDVSHGPLAALGNAAPASADASTNHMAASMHRGVPASTQILFDARVEPLTDTLLPAEGVVKGSLNPKLKNKSLKRYDVLYIFPGRQLEFTESADHTRHGAVEFQLAAYDVQGTMLTSLSQSIQLPLKPDEYARQQRAPFRFAQQLDLPAGDIFLRLGVHDLTSDKVGTLEIPLNVTRKSAPASPAVAGSPASSAGPLN